MNLKQIQAVEFILFKINPNKRLVVEYKDQLLSADFLAYSKPYSDTITIYALADESNSKLLDSENSNMFYAHNSLYDYTRSDDFTDDTFIKLGNKNYKLSENRTVTPQTLKDTVQHVLKYDKDPKSSEKIMANVTPSHVQFLNTNTELPFYLFPEEAEFTIVSLIDRKLTFD